VLVGIAETRLNGAADAEVAGKIQDARADSRRVTPCFYHLRPVRRKSV
jgi:hypothetical protein